MGRLAQSSQGLSVDCADGQTLCCCSASNACIDSDTGAAVHLAWRRRRGARVRARRGGRPRSCTQSKHDDGENGGQSGCAPEARPAVVQIVPLAHRELQHDGVGLREGVSSSGRAGR